MTKNVWKNSLFHVSLGDACLRMRCLQQLKRLIIGKRNGCGHPILFESCITRTSNLRGRFFFIKKINSGGFEIFRETITMQSYIRQIRAGAFDSSLQNRHNNT